MAFSNILLFILVCYIIYYVANIAYDMFFRKEDVDMVPKVDEEEVDISDLAETFQPVSIVKDAPAVHWEDPIYDEEKDARVEAMVRSALISDKTSHESDEEGRDEENPERNEGNDGLITNTDNDDDGQENEIYDSHGMSQSTEDVKDNEKKVEEVQFHPDESPASRQQDDEEYHETTLMTGAIEINDLKPMIDEYADDPENSQLKEIIGIWE